MIEIEADLADFKAHLSPRVFDKAVRAATRKLGSRAATQINRATRQIYDIRAAEITRALTKISQDSGRAVHLRYKGHRKGLISFKSRLKNVPVTATSKGGRTFKTRRKGVSVVVRKAGGRFTVPGAFVAAGFGGNFHIFRRKNKNSKARGPIERLTGPAVPQMVKNDRVRQAAGRELAGAYSGILGHELTRAFNATL